MDQTSGLFSLQELSHVERAKLVASFWPKSDQNIRSFASYFRYYRHVYELLSWGCGSPLDPKAFAARNLDEVLSIQSSMRRDRSKTRQEIASTLHREKFQNFDLNQIKRSMELTATLWLTVNIRSPDIAWAPLQGGVHNVEWDDGVTLLNMIKQPFRESALVPSAREARLDPGFTAFNIQHICGIRIEFTSNLPDHLYIPPQVSPPHNWWRRIFWKTPQRVLYVYPHKICLMSHWRQEDSFPKALLEETFRSLDLLFPPGDGDTRALLLAKNEPFFNTESLTVPRTIDLADFSYWRSRLVSLYDVFNAPPTGFRQMWRDRRNPMQWWTFWLAAFIFVLTILYGAVGSYISLKQTSLAEKAYRLSLLRACFPPPQNKLIADMCKTL
jgi:hypothetical protein